MATRNQVLQELVKREAKNLRKFAISKELQKLEIDELNSTDGTQCIYGQMTGDCFSARASELIEQCCERVYSSNKTIRGEIDNNVANSPLNGKPKDRSSYFSPIEVFIANNSIKDTDDWHDEKFILGYTAADNENNKRLVKYLKGETNRLTFVK